jgi:predicted phosphodiesterase
MRILGFRQAGPGGPALSWNRRRFLALLGLGGVVSLSGAVYVKGVRYPVLQFEPRPAPRSGSAYGIMVAAQGAMAQPGAGAALFLRAYAPEPELLVQVTREGPWVLTISNLHPEAVLEVSDPRARLQEETTGLTRRVTGQLAPATPFRLAWRFPRSESYRFAAIGDTGGNAELRWVLRRSVELKADFLLHLGDINYQPGDFPSALAAFDAARIPSYVAIGNHDFTDESGSVHHIFTSTIGPRNSTFNLGGVQFVNLDTALDSLPPGMGRRGEIIRSLPALDVAPLLRDYVVFTHRPLVDPRAAAEPDAGHGVNGLGEATWLRRNLLSRGMDTLLAGHVHIGVENDDQGLHTYVSGQGLAHADLLVDRPIARILVGDVAPGEPVHYHWEALNMPLSSHCNTRTWRAVAGPGTQLPAACGS